MECSANRRSLVHPSAGAGIAPGIERLSSPCGSEPGATFVLLLSLLPAMATVIGILVLRQMPGRAEAIGIAPIVAGVALHRAH